MNWIKNLRLVEVEIHSYCNRTCNWCPNSYINRTFYKELPEEVFLKLLNELSGMNYNKYLSFSRYNEPFAKRSLLKKRIKQVREILPNVIIVCNTNGDFKYDNIDIDELTIMDYDHIKNETCSPNLRQMRLKDINNRAGALDIQKKYIRNFSCLEPKYFVGIDYTGDVVPCCNIRSDVELHKPWILGNLKNMSLEEILSSDKAVRFRQRVELMDFPYVCKKCSKKPGRYTRDNPGIEK